MCPFHYITLFSVHQIWEDGSYNEKNENAQTNPTENEKSTSAQSTENAANQEIFEYIGNANTKKFHYPDCGAVSQMKEKNKVYLNCTRDEAIKDGYNPCGRCNP